MTRLMICNENILSVYKIKQNFQYAFLRDKLILAYIKDSQLVFYDVQKQVQSIVIKIDKVLLFEGNGRDRLVVGMTSRKSDTAMELQVYGHKGVLISTCEIPLIPNLVSFYKDQIFLYKIGTLVSLKFKEQIPKADATTKQS